MKTKLSYLTEAINNDLENLKLSKDEMKKWGIKMRIVLLVDINHYGIKHKLIKQSIELINSMLCFPY